MPITLAQAKAATQDAIQQGVIDEFRRSSYIMDTLTFDDSVTPGTAGKTLTYGYSRIKSIGTAGFRAFNAEYTPQQADTERITVDLKVFGGSFEIDRVFTQTGGLFSQMAFQLSEKTKAAIAVFNDTFINGDSAVDANAFDGLNKALVNANTEFNALNYLDLSTENAFEANYKKFLDLLDETMSFMDGKPHCICGNTQMINKIKAAARRSGYYTRNENAFGQKVDAYDNIPLMDLGDKAGFNTPVVPFATRTINATPISGLTDLYFCRMALDGVHGISIAGQSPIKTYLPNMNLPGAVKTGEVEAVAAIALKKTRAAGVLRNIKIK